MPALPRTIGVNDHAVERPRRLVGSWRDGMTTAAITDDETRPRPSDTAEGVADAELNA